jgi:hypothetical protein
MFRGGVFTSQNKRYEKLPFGLHGRNECSDGFWRVAAGTSALYSTELTLTAPAEAGMFARSVAFALELATLGFDKCPEKSFIANGDRRHGGLV